MLTISFFEKFTTKELNILTGIIESVKSKRTDLFPERVNISDVSVRCINTLRKFDIYYWYELTKFTKNEIQRYFGPMTVNEIKREMKKRNIQFRQT